MMHRPGRGRLRAALVNTSKFLIVFAIAGVMGAMVLRGPLPRVASSSNDDFSGATAIGAQLGGERASAVLERAASAFTNAFNTGMIVSAAIAFAAAAIVLRTLSASREAGAAAAAAASDAEVALR